MPGVHRHAPSDPEHSYPLTVGVGGGAIDALVGQRIAEASVHRFVRDVARHLSESIGKE
jgi:hypothetical protein